MYQCRTGDTARLLVIRQGNIIGDNDHLDLQAIALGFFCRQAEIKPVAGVIFHDQQTTPIARYRHNGVQHRINARRSKKIPAHRCCEHPFADKPGVCRFVTRATA